MNKKEMVRLSIWLLNLFVILLLIWSLINYEILDNEVTKFVQFGGLFAMIFIVVFLEGAPVFVGPSVAVATVLAIGVFNPMSVLTIFLGSALLGNILYYFLGYFSGKRILKYFKAEDVKKYKKFFKKYGGITLMTMAVSPVPYLPTLA